MIKLKKIKRESEWNLLYYDIIPVIQDSGVYMLYDKNDDLIYIGHTQNINQRLQQHCKNDNKDWIYARVILIEDKEHRLIMEKLLIAYMNPIYNKNSPCCLNVSFNLDSNKLIEMQKKTSKSILAINLLKDLIENLNESDIINSKTTMSLNKQLYNVQYDTIRLHFEIASYLNFSYLGKIQEKVNDYKPTLFDQ
jgi:hypothetical protein